MAPTIPSRTTTRPPDRPLSPTQRAAVRVALAHALGAGRPVTREQVIAELFPAAATPAPASATPAAISVELLPDPATVDVPGVPTPDPDPVASDPTPDVAVSFAEAAERLGLSIATVRRYSAPSSGRLTRLGTGVSRASITSLEASR